MVAETIIQQMGGTRRLKVMAGCNNFVSHGDENAVSFRVGRNAEGVNYCMIRLNDADLYDVELRYVSLDANDLKAEWTDVYLTLV
jgi:hypothetical protein